MDSGLKMSDLIIKCDSLVVNKLSFLFWFFY